MNEIVREGTRYWVEMRHDHKSRWNAWIDTPEHAAALAEYERLKAAFPDSEWRFGRTVERVEVLASGA